MGNKLDEKELAKLSKRLRGKRKEIAKRANVGLGTVHNTFENKHQNMKVLEVAAEMVKEMNAQEINPIIAELRELLLEETVSQSN